MDCNQPLELEGLERPRIRSAEDLLVENIQRGDQSAACRLVSQHYAGVYAYLSYLTGQKEEAEDLTQDTFVYAWRNLAGFDGSRASLGTWLRVIARSRFLRWQQSRRKEDPLTEADALVDPHSGDAMTALEVRDGLMRLPPALREVAVLHYLVGHDCREVAEIVDRPEGTVKRWLLEARKLLHREWSETESDGRREGRR
jgi:RNA polymerase sigma-70 factor (ECF subfamily)